MHDWCSCSSSLEEFASGILVFLHLKNNTLSREVGHLCCWYTIYNTIITVGRVLNGWVFELLLHSKKACSGLMKTALNNVVLPTLFNVVNNVVQHC